jgi:DNA-binding response OmpR family regulator
MMKVLVAEDDELIRRGLVEILEAEGYTAVEAEDGERALEAFAAEGPDFVLLDIMMPGRSGYDVCKEIRKTDAVVPVIFVSAKSEEIDKVLGLELGADDFIVKPFGVREVVARIRAVTRRCIAAREPRTLPAEFSLGDLTVSPSELRARRGDDSFELSLREVRILELFARSPGKVLTREEIFESCWDQDFYPLSRTLDQHISKLRKRVEVDPKNPRLIATIHGVGYRYDP